MLRSVGLSALVLVLLPGLASAQDTEWNRYTLEGLDGVYVRGEATDACSGSGFEMGTIEAMASSALIEAEVPMLSEEEMLAAPGLPELRISVECSSGGDGVAFSASVRMQQATQMIRDTQITLSEAVTWYAVGVGMSDADGASAAIQETIEAKLGEFIEAFKAANEGEDSGSR